jgi:adenylate cyclase
MRGPATPPRQTDRAQAGFARAWEWYLRLPRRTARALTLAVFLFLINVFSGLHHIWFQWPAALLLLIAILSAKRS